jgi:hypothetical protein
MYSDVIENRVMSSTSEDTFVGASFRVAFLICAPFFSDLSMSLPLHTRGRHAVVDTGFVDCLGVREE